MSRIPSLVAAGVVLALGLAGIAGAQQAQPRPAALPPQSSGETLIIGSTTLRLGISKDSVLPAVALQDDVPPVTPGRMYPVRMGKSVMIGVLYLNDQGDLVAKDLALTGTGTGCDWPDLFAMRTANLAMARIFSSVPMARRMSTGFPARIWRRT